MSRKLTKKQKVALHRLADHYNVMSNLCLALLDENEGGWYNYDDDPIWANSSEGLSIHKRKNGTLYVRLGEKCVPEPRYTIDDPILIDLLNQLASKPKAKKGKKKPTVDELAEMMDFLTAPRMTKK